MPADISFEGRLVRDPELRFIPNGDAVVSFTVANNKRIKNAAGDWEDGDPMFLRCTAWRQMAESIAESLGRGDLVVARGTLNEDHYEKDGEKKTSWNVTVDYIGASLRWKLKTQGKPQTDSSSASGSDVPF